MLTYEIIDNYKEDGSSALCLDIRNSTKIIRQFTTKAQLEFHAKFLLKIKELLFTNSTGVDYSFNDTGDGMICLFWNKTHAWSAIRIGIAMHDLINNYLHKNYETFLTSNKINEKFGFGIGIHCGGSLIYRHKKHNKDFMFGKVLNTTARLESFTKTYKNINILFTEHFIDVLKKQQVTYNKLSSTENSIKPSDLNKSLRRISTDRIEINDAKNEGHLIWTIAKTHSALLSK